MKEIIWSYDHVIVGMDIIVHLMPDGHSAQGGVVDAIDDETVFLDCGTAHYKRAIRRANIYHVTREVPYDADECLDYNPDTCRGPVDDWWSGGSHGRNWPRCTLHGELRLQGYERSMERYADSDVVPDWFREDDIGERWNDDY